MKRFVLLACVLLAGCGTHREHPKGWGFPNAPRSARLAPNPATTATMYDSITLSTIPPNPFALAGYTSGFWPTYLPMRRTWPNAHTVSIDVTSRYHGDCLDVEPGDATPAEVPAWVLSDRRAGFAKPCVYSSYYEFIHEVRPRLFRAGITRGQVFEWDADYTYTPHIDASFDATQWTDRALGRNLDASVVSRTFLSIAQPPLPTNAQRISVLRTYARGRGCYKVWAHERVFPGGFVRVRKPHACYVWAKEVRELER